VLIMAFIGALMWGAYKAIWDTAKQNTEDKAAVPPRSPGPYQAGAAAGFTV
jgi:hypothetical protein